MKKAIWPVFWALVGDFVVLAMNFIPAVGQWSLTYMAFLPLLVGVLFFLLGIALLVLTLKGKVTGWLRTFLIMTGAAPIAIPIGFVLLDAAPETLAGIFSCVVLIAFLTGIIGSIILARRQPKKAIRRSRARRAR
jgi:ABC-type antimicrobial peptide transport system permease subunit